MARMRRVIHARQGDDVGILPPGARFQVVTCVDIHAGTAGVCTGVSRVLPEGTLVVVRYDSGRWAPVGVTGDRPVRLPGAANVWVHPDGLMTHGSGRELSLSHTYDAWVRFINGCVATIAREMAMA